MHEPESSTCLFVERMARFPADEIILSKQDELRILRAHARQSSQEIDRTDNY